VSWKINATDKKLIIFSALFPFPEAKKANLIKKRKNINKNKA